MRTTIDLPPELHRVLASLAATNSRTLSQTAVDLLERGLRVQPAGARGRAPAQSKRTGLPLVRLQRVVTPEDVRALEDEG